jgi:hypothetical protein
MFHITSYISNFLEISDRKRQINIEVRLIHFVVNAFLYCCVYLFQARAFSTSPVQQQLVKVSFYNNAGKTCVGALLNYVDPSD